MTNDYNVCMRSIILKTLFLVCSVQELNKGYTLFDPLNVMPAIWIETYERNRLSSQIYIAKQTHKQNCGYKNRTDYIQYFGRFTIPKNQQY